MLWGRYSEVSEIPILSCYIDGIQIRKSLKYWLQNTLKLKTNITITLSIVNSSTPDLFSSNSRSTFQNPESLENSSNSSTELPRSVEFAQIERKQCSVPNGFISIQNKIREVYRKPSSKISPQNPRTKSTAFWLDLR